MRRREAIQSLAALPLVGGLLHETCAADEKADLPPSAGAKDPLYDPKLHLFIDDHGVLRSSNVSRMLGRAKRHPVPVVKADRPWESPWVYAWGSVMREPGTGQFRMWYETMGYNGTI